MLWYHCNIPNRYGLNFSQWSIRIDKDFVKVSNTLTYYWRFKSTSIIVQTILYGLVLMCVENITYIDSYPRIYLFLISPISTVVDHTSQEIGFDLIHSMFGWHILTNTLNTIGCRWVSSKYGLEFTQTLWYCCSRFHFFLEN